MKLKEGSLFLSKKGQITIFIIIAILIVAIALAYFFLWDPVTVEEVPAEFEPVYQTFLACVEDATLTGASILASQGGHIDLPEFEPGSDFMPFSSQLNFFGNPIPYWYYVSGNNIEREQVASKSDMEGQLGEFINDKIEECRYDSYYEEGFEIFFGEPESRVRISDNDISVEMSMEIDMHFGEKSVRVTSHSVSVNSLLGDLHSSALDVYAKQQDTLFLEEYAMDVLWNYAPVNDVEITCSPLIHNADEIFDELQEAIEANTLALTNVEARDDYFNIELPIDYEVNFLNSKMWPHSFEVNPTEDNLLVANPVGTQKGLGVLGFCYVAYHYVYDMKYPVLVQISSEEEVFQFPMAVIIRGNNPREPLAGEAIEDTSPPICEDLYRNTLIDVNVIDANGVPVEADIYYECLGSGCRIGRTSLDGNLVDYFPQCVNGFVSARTEDYADARMQFSTVDEGSVSIILDELHEKELQLNIGGIASNEEAIIYFESLTHGTVQTFSYPSITNVELAEGEYEIEVRVFGDADIKFGDFVGEQCVQVPRGGLLGVIGMEEERCFEVEVSEQELSQVLVAGGRQRQYIFESDLRDVSRLNLNVERFPTPSDLYELQDNEILFETKGIEVGFG